MGVAGSASRQCRAATKTATEKRTKAPKPQSRCASASQHVAALVRKQRGRPKPPKPLGPGTRPGAHQELPITIDSDDEAESVASLETGASPAVHAYRLPAAPQSRAASCPDGPTARKSNLSYTLGPGPCAFNSPPARYERADTPQWFALPLQLAHYQDQKLYEERLVSVEPSTPSNFRQNFSFAEQTTARPNSQADDRSRRAQTVSAGPYSRHLPIRTVPGIPNAQLQRPLVRNAELSPPASLFADDGIEMTLADINDFDLRQKAAQLMAVAPGLPVADLYHLLMNRKGHFEVAKQDAIRQSQVPYTSPPARNPFASGRATTVPPTAPIHIQEEGEDDTYIKIDFDDPDFMFDNDAPATPQAESGRQRRHSQAKTKKVAPKTTVKSKKNTMESARIPKSGSAQSRSSTYTVPSSSSTYAVTSAKVPKCPQTPSRASRPRKGHAVKNPKGKGAGDINRGMRATSFDLEFIVPDDEVLDESDDTYSESNESLAGEIDMTDDETDLTIDMEPEYAYNSNILMSPGSR